MHPPPKMSFKALYLRKAIWRDAPPLFRERRGRKLDEAIHDLHKEIVFFSTLFLLFQFFFFFFCLFVVFFFFSLRNPTNFGFLPIVFLSPVKSCAWRPFPR